MVELYSCISSESRKFFKRVVYLKQINFITGDPLAAECPGKLLPLTPPLNPALGWTGPSKTFFFKTSTRLKPSMLLIETAKSLKQFCEP